ncbi:MAG: ABC transporter ATP-binding protein [Planctomycetota bacterium]
MADSRLNNDDDSISGMEPRLRDHEGYRGAVWAMTQLTGGAHDVASTPRRVVSEAMQGWPGPTRLRWSDWLNEASKAMGLRCRRVDCTVEQAMDLIRQNVRLVTYHEEQSAELSSHHEDGQAEAGPGNGRWLISDGSSWRKYRVSTHQWKKSKKVRDLRGPAQAKIDSAWLSERRLRRRLEQATEGGILRCLLVQNVTTESSASDGGGSTKPWARFRRLLAPEWSDVWIVLVFAFMVGLLSLATPIAVESLVNTVAFGRLVQPVVILAVILFTFLGFLAITRALQTYVVEIIQRRLFARVAADLAYRIPRSEMEATDKSYRPELVNRFFDVVTVQKVTAGLLLDGVSLVISAVIGMIVLAFYHPWLLGFDVLLLSSIAFIMFVLGRGAVGSAIKESKTKYYMAHWLEDLARTPTAFRGDGGPTMALEHADTLVAGYLTARRNHFRILLRQILFTLGLQAIASTALLGLGGWLVISEELTLGQLVAAELIVTMVVGSFAKMAKHIESFYDALASVDKLGVLFDLPLERQDGILPTKLVSGHEAESIEQAAEVELHAIAYAWPGKKPILDNLTTELKPGTTLGVLGGSGTGKSTLQDIVFGFRAPTAGHLTVDGIDPRDLRPEALRRRVALVRDDDLFHGSLEENVHLHRENVTAVEVRDALQQVGLLDRVRRKADGLNTILQSNGRPLTENECRLLTVARAIAGQPGLILVDGVLDALPDQELELALHALLRPDRPWTLIVTTGRESIASRLDEQLHLKSSYDLTTTASPTENGGETS